MAGRIRIGNLTWKKYGKLRRIGFALAVCGGVLAARELGKAGWGPIVLGGLPGAGFGSALTVVQGKSRYLRRSPLARGVRWAPIAPFAIALSLYLDRVPPAVLAATFSTLGGMTLMIGLIPDQVLAKTMPDQDQPDPPSG